MAAERIAQLIYLNDVAILARGQIHTNIASELGKLIRWVFDITNRDGAGCWLSGGTDDQAYADFGCRRAGERDWIVWFYVKA